MKKPKKKDKPSEATVQAAEKPSQKKKLKKQAVPSVEAKNSTLTPDRFIRDPENQNEIITHIGKLWNRQDRIEKALTVLAPKVDFIMKALEEGKKRAQAAQQQLPEVPKGKQKGGLPISEGLIERGIGVLEKAFTGPEPDSTHSMIEKKLIDKAINDVLTTVDNDRAVGAALRQHIKKYGFKGKIELGKSDE